MHQLVYEAEKTLLSSNEKFEDFGALLNETWMMKKKTGIKVTNNALDDIYEEEDLYFFLHDQNAI